jgi:hypothetical protein
MRGVIRFNLPLLKEIVTLHAVLNKEATNSNNKLLHSLFFIFFFLFFSFYLIKKSNKSFWSDSGYKEDDDDTPIGLCSKGSNCTTDSKSVVGGSSCS